MFKDLDFHLVLHVERTGDSKLATGLNNQLTWSGSFISEFFFKKKEENFFARVGDFVILT